MFNVLASVSDKRGLAALFKGMRDVDAKNLKIISTGGTMKELVDAGLEVVPIEDYTGVPEGMNDRVKTLNTRTSAGLLWGGSHHDEFLEQVGAMRIPMYVGNLYPFQQTVDSGAIHELCIKNIDIGGPTNWRALAKNYVNGLVLSNPDQYEPLLKFFQQAGRLAIEAVPLGFREDLAGAVFDYMEKYDGAIAKYFRDRKRMRQED